MKRLPLLLLCLLLTLGLAGPALADDEAAAPAGYLGDFLVDFDGVSEKLNSLAEAMPAEQYAHAVSDEVRNFGQVLVHVAGANFFLSRALGVEPPEEMGQDMEEKFTTKDEIMALLAKSQEHVRKAVAMSAEADLEEELEIFGGKRSRRGVLLIIAGHNHEHLGQSIAYIRGAGHVPPWSQAE